MNPPKAQDVLLTLALADGNRWEIAAGDKEAAAIVSRLGRAMQLPGTPGVLEPPPHGRPGRLLVQVEAQASAADCSGPPAAHKNGQAVVCLDPCENWGGPFVNLVRLSLIFARQAQTRGGVLVHGALAERDGLGVIMVAPSGTGKTTASNRLPAPWRSLSDDATLAVRDPQGRYWAHPWPTWSRFLDGGPGGTWDVQGAVPLKGIFFLAQAAADRVERLGPGRAVSLLVESVGQVSTFMIPGLVKEELHALHLEQFENLCALVRVIPAHLLHISLTGDFWQEMDQALAGACCEEPQETISRNESD